MTATATDNGPQVGTVRHVQPKDLLLMRNIRETKLDAEFVASIKEHGLLEPIVAVINDDGGLVVRYGHRRALGAVEAGLGSVPVYIAGSDDTADPAEIDRIIRQHDENTRRTGLTAVEEVGVVEQLAAFGLSPAQIVKRKRMPRAAVDAALAVAQSAVAAAAAARAPDMTLEQAATLAEFEESPEIVEELIEAAADSPGEFAHAAQHARDERLDQSRRAAVREELEAAGITVLSESPGWAWQLTYMKVSAGGAQLTKKNHAKCPGHVAWVGHQGYDDDRDVVYGPVYGCSAWSKHGHYHTQRSSTARVKDDDMPDEEREKAKQARALVIGNNKAWVSATKVRRDWLAAFAKLKAAPKGTAAFVSWALERQAYKLQDLTGQRLASEWLGVDTREIHVAAFDATETRALQVVLIQVLGAFEEAALDNMTWRRNGTHEWHGRYLKFLEACGYTLSEVEQYAVSTKTA